MTDQLRRDLHALMRTARDQFERQAPFDAVSDLAVVVDDYLAARDRLIAMAQHARQLRAPAHPLQEAPARTGRPIMPHEDFDPRNGSNPALDEALGRR